MTRELTEIISVRFPKSVVDAMRERHAAEGILPSEQIRRAVSAAMKPTAAPPKVEYRRQPLLIPQTTKEQPE